MHGLLVIGCCGSGGVVVLLTERESGIDKHSERRLAVRGCCRALMSRACA
jgi:hypothetical protein